MLADVTRESLARCAELEAAAHDLPELDQALAALRELGEHLHEFATCPLWRPFRLCREYRAAKVASGRLRVEMRRLGLPTSDRL